MSNILKDSVSFLNRQSYQLIGVVNSLEFLFCQNSQRGLMQQDDGFIRDISLSFVEYVPVYLGLAMEEGCDRRKELLAGCPLLKITFLIFHKDTEIAEGLESEFKDLDLTEIYDDLIQRIKDKFLCKRKSLFLQYLF